MKHLNQFFALVATAIISISSSNLSAATRTWTGATSTNWSTSSNWSGNTAPGSTDTVVIPSSVSSNRNPVFTSNVSIRRFVMNGLSVSQTGGRTFTTSGDILINGGTFTSGNTVSCNNFTINGGSFISGSNSLTVTNNLIINDGTLNSGTGTTSADNVDVNNGTHTIQGDRLNLGNDYTIDGGTVQVTGNDFDIDDDFFFLSGTLDLNGFDLNINDNYTYQGGSLTDPGSLITANDVFVDFSGTHTMGISLRVESTMTFTNGIIETTNTNFIIFDFDATVSAVSNTSHVKGPIRKEISSSNTTPAFTFPIGNGSYYAPIGISNYGSRRNADYFTATYFDVANSNASGTVGSGLNLVSKEEYWILDRAATSGTASTTAVVTLSYNTSRSGPITNASLLKVARWNGSQWTDHGRASGSSSSNTSGNVISSAAVSSFSPFTLGSSTNVNPLPITLLNFTAKALSNAVAIDWSTTSEINNDYFTLEKSYNGTEWISIAKIQGAGNSETLSQYAHLDNQIVYGVQFYRLKQTDINGDFTYSQIVSIKFDQTINTTLSIFPVPANNFVTITSNNDPTANVSITVINALGQKVLSMDGTGNKHQLDIQELETGIYYIEMQSEGTLLSAKFQKL